MALLDETAGIPRRSMTLFFMVDTSGSMSGTKIAAVNDAIDNVIPMIKDISDENSDAEIYVAALEFSSGVSWLYDEPKKVSEFTWQPVSAGGSTVLGEACRELSKKLSRKDGFMTSSNGSYAPAIILLSDGAPTDDFDSGLEKLKENNWFKAGIKAAIAIGDDADKEVLARFTGTSESVITVHSIDMLKQMIRIMAVSSSRIGSQSSAAGTASKQDQFNKQVQEAKQNLPDDDYGDW